MADKRKIIIGLIVSIIAVLSFFLADRCVSLYKDNQIKNATIIVNMADNLSVPFNTECKVSDFIDSINGEIIDDYEIDTVDLGEQEISFEYINDENIKVPYTFKINVEDVTSPLVWLGNDYYVTTNFSSTLEEKILCADDYDDNPVCTVEGDYDTSKVGNYSLNFKAVDASGNETNIPFTLHVSKPSTSSSSSSSNKFAFSDAVELFKNETTSVGIDVSSWQGDIDFEKLKESGVDFAFVRVGSKWGTDGEFFLDSKFDANMQGFNDAGIPVGVYFYSYAKNEEEAKEEAEWVIDKLKEYNVDLPVAFDFEDWSRYNSYNMSLYRLNRNATVFIETLESAEYEGMLYGSISYLSKMWNTEGKTVWAAHYTKNADYSDSYKFWQFSASGRVDGIYGDVDLDVMYNK